MKRFVNLLVIATVVLMVIGCGKAKQEAKPKKEDVVQQMQIVRPDAETSPKAPTGKSKSN